MVNLYEILEVSEKASKEVIDKAYHVLVKKYHPDLQPPEKKQEAEEKMKQINKAYEILIDEEKRKEYDLKQEQKKKEQIQNKQREEEKRKQVEIKEFYQKQIEKEKRKEEIQRKQQEDYENAQKLQEEMDQVYEEAYNDYWRSLGYKIKEPWTWKRFLKLLKTLSIFILIFVILWFFPPTHKWMIEFYEENIVIKTIVNLLGNILQGMGKGIQTFFHQYF